MKKEGETMEQKKKIEKLEELLDLEEGTLSEEDQLDEIEEWDSIAHLSLIILLEEEYGVKVSGNEIRSAKIVRDILNLMD